MKNEYKIAGIILAGVVAVIVLRSLFGVANKNNIPGGKLAPTVEVHNTKAALTIMAESVSTPGSPVTYSLVGTFTEVSPGEKLSYFKTEISFPKDSLEIPKGEYIDTSMSGFNKVVRVDGPLVSNMQGLVTIELSSDDPQSGPAIGNSITFAKIRFSRKGVAKVPAVIQSGKTLMKNNNSLEIPVNQATFTIPVSAK